MATLQAIFASVLIAASVSPAAARDVPSNVRDLYKNITSENGCNDVLADGFYSQDGDGGSSMYCGDHLEDYGIIYLKGPKKDLVNMDIDCDGAQDGPANDGRCGSSTDTQSITSFQDRIEEYGSDQKDLDALIHPYVVFGNEGSKKNWATFDPEEHGIKPLSIIAVVCGDKLVYGVWGDTNGDDGDEPMVGEASISLATACFGKKVNGNSGHDDDDVLYIAFAGSDAVPGADGAKWDAKNFKEFEDSIEELGDRLVERIGSDTYEPSDDDDGDDDDDDDDSASWFVGAPTMGSSMVLALATLGFVHSFW